MPDQCDREDPFAYFVLLGFCVGLQSIIKQHLPRYAKRLEHWKEELWEEFKLLEIRDGTFDARIWLMNQLTTPRLPDLRRGKSLADDRLLVDRYNSLMKELRPIFQEYQRNCHNRIMKAAPIVSRIMGDTRDGHDFPTTPKLSEFCKDVLGAGSVRLARAKRRLGQKRTLRVSNTVRMFKEALSVSGKTPDEVKTIKTALRRLQSGMTTRTRRGLH